MSLSVMDTPVDSESDVSSPSSTTQVAPWTSPSVSSIQQARELGHRISTSKLLSQWSDDELEWLKAQVGKHSVVCVESQEGLTAPEFRQLAERLAAANNGEVIRLPSELGFRNHEPSDPAIIRVGNVNVDGTIRPSWNAAEYWHQDGDFWPDGEHAIWNMLTMRVKPEKGGDTGFLDLVKAYDRLPDDEKETLKQAQTVLTLGDIQDFAYVAAHPEVALVLNKQSKAGDISFNKPIAHQTLHWHPYDEYHRKVVYLGSNVASIETSGVKVSCAELIDRNAEKIESEAKAKGDVGRGGIVSTCGVALDYLHRWQVGDFLIWDNISVMHRSMGGFGDSPRLLWRMQIRTRPQHQE